MLGFDEKIDADPFEFNLGSPDAFGFVLMRLSDAYAEV